MRRSAVILMLLSVSAVAAAQSRMDPEGLWRLARVGGGTVSPDGDSVLYSLRRYDLATNRGDSDLWISPLAGGNPRRLTDAATSESDAQWVRTRAGLRVYFTARRGDLNLPQVFSLDPADGTLVQETDFALGVQNLKVAPGGGAVAFTADVKLDPTIADLHPDLPLADARLIDGLLYRHWDQWHDYAYSHLFVAQRDAEGRFETPRDLMPGLRADCPVPPFGGSEQFAWSPDAKRLAFTMKLVADPARSTDSDVYVVEATGGERLNVSDGFDGYDNNPVFSPDGRLLAWHSMERAGFESDRNRILAHEFESGTTFEVTAGLDRTAHDATWLPDSRSMLFSSESRGTDQIYRVSLDGGDLIAVTRGRFNWSIAGLSPDGRTLVAARQDMIRPTELFAVSLDGGETRQITDANAPAFADLAVPSIEERWTRATDGRAIHSWVIKPPDFDESKAYPLIVYCQGGPQGQIGQWFSYRWNFHLMAARGYVVLAVNRRGLPGFGQDWNDEISGDWGGQAMRDILSATDSILGEPWIDRRRTAAVGASFGGFTVYWLMGNARDRFQCMVAHAGVFNLESMYGSTEELFFVDWDLGGPYWKSEAAADAYARFSPHRFVGNWRTPLLVVHGEKDFRVPVTQGMEAFTAAQVEGVPSRFLYFPEEGHWVQSPQNGVLWHRVFFDWLDRWTGLKKPR